MAENKMAEVAKLLGLELEEEFKITDSHTKYKLTSKGMKAWSVSDQKWLYSNLLQILITGMNQIIKIPKPILDDVEKKYLSAVIKPFRDKVISITKYDDGDGGDYIQITVKQNIYSEYIDLPYFKKGTMYKGMEVKKEYTLKELGL